MLGPRCRKQDYDPSRQVIEVEQGNRRPARKIDVYSGSIGVVATST